MVTVYINSTQFYTLWDYIYIYCTSHTLRKGWKGIAHLHSFPKLLEHPTVLHFPQIPGLSRSLLPIRNTGCDTVKDSHFLANSHHDTPHQSLHSEIMVRVMLNKIFSKCFPACIKETSLQLGYLMRHLLGIWFQVSYLSFKILSLLVLNEKNVCLERHGWGDGYGTGVGRFPVLRPTVHQGNCDYCKGSKGWKLSVDRD